MRQSQLFTKVQREFPKDEISKNAQILIRAGYIHKEMAGVYALLPLGLRVIERIKKIVREEMNSLGSQELLMTSLQRKELWEETNRWDDEKVDVWFKSRLKNNVEIGFGWSHEEPITKMMTHSLESFRDLPVSVYQFQTKLRNELRAKSGIMRGREFLMKDLYSYSRSEEEHQVFYQSVVAAYQRIFQRVGIGEDTFFTFASGGAFTQFSHEFQTITDAGEDFVYLSREKNIAVNEEVFTDEVLSQLDLSREDLIKVKTSEVGNIFSFGGKKCEQLGLYFKDEKGIRQPVVLGSYGIGITRLMGVIVEKFSDEKGLVWPREVSPFDVHLLVLDGTKDDSNIRKTADELYEKLLSEGIDVLYDERNVRAGEKFSESDFLGIPLRIVVSARSLEKGGVEVKKREEDSSTILSFQALMESFKEEGK
ncbi:MAG: prolyl-tRNA synthetase [Candidatus Moraniibacteriota bacterium]|nr:MAG: prolyl-tRNA synthetase [Candidatus Moranbacteria bacterium]